MADKATGRMRRRLYEADAVSFTSEPSISEKGMKIDYDRTSCSIDSRVDHGGKEKHLLLLLQPHRYTDRQVTVVEQVRLICGRGFYIKAWLTLQDFTLGRNGNNEKNSIK